MHARQAVQHRWTCGQSGNFIRMSLALTLRLTTFAIAFVTFAPRVPAQSIASGVIRGTVRTEAGAVVDGARVRVTNTANGVAVSSTVRRGRFVVQGLETGGPYVVEVLQIGFTPLRTQPFQLPLGEPVEFKLTMKALAVGLDTVVVADKTRRSVAPGETLISDSLVHRLPTPNRNFYDFVALAPQISTKIGFGRSGVSAAGANLRFNSYLINGADERSVNGSLSAAANAGKSVPLDAVREYTVLVAPYDVRYGDFAGALINTVTQSGTNELRGSTSAYWRNDWLARSSKLETDAVDERLQYGFSAGGPIVRDRIHFFVAAEAQRLDLQAPGAFVGQSPTRSPSLPASESDISRFQEIMRGKGLTPGTSRRVVNGSPLSSVFARLDASLPRLNSRAVGFVSTSSRRDDVFSHSAPDSFSLSSFSYASGVGQQLISLQLHTDVPRGNGWHNELFVSRIREHSDFVPDVRQPLIRVRVPGVNGVAVTVNGGTAEAAQGRFGSSQSIKLRDEVSMPLGSRHLVFAGAQAERFQISRGGVIGGYGAWTFLNLDDFQAGTPERFELRKDFGSASRPLKGGEYTGYVGDEWQIGRRFSLTTGVRAERFGVDVSAPYNRTIDSIFSRRTDQMPRARLHISPRVGFDWEVSSGGRDRVRGGIGVFTGRPPLSWYVGGLANNGEGIGVLRCGFVPTDAGQPPKFVSDYLAAPTRCATGPTLEARPNGEVDLLDRDLRMAQSMRGTIAYERRLPAGIVATSEIMVSRYLSDFRWVNLNLAGVQATDKVGRVIYGSFSSTGIATPALRTTGFAEVIDLTNTSMNRSYQLSQRFERRFAQRFGGLISYTYSSVRDVQSPSRVNQTGIAMWSDARAVSGRHDKLQREISLNDIPHRVVAAFSYTAPWRLWSTGLSFYYVGESGSPFTYVATGVNRRGDLNADGSNTNDPIYVPRNASDASEIQFSGLSEAVGADNSSAAQATRIASQALAFERFVETTPCLRRQRGRLLARNSCREPFSQTTVASVQQAIPIRGAAFEAELDLHNVLNLLNRDWGRQWLAAPRVLEHVGQTTGPAATSQPIFKFNETRDEWTSVQESAFQIQVAFRYRF